MTGSDLLPAAVLRRKAVVYVRQSTQQQVQLHTESTRRDDALLGAAPRAARRRAAARTSERPTQRAPPSRGSNKPPRAPAARTNWSRSPGAGASATSR